MTVRSGQFAAALLGTCAWAGVAGTAAAAEPKYKIDRLGLTDAEHTRADGYRYSNWIDLSDRGDATGFSYRYLGSQQVGESAWFFHGQRSEKIGLVDDAHRLNNFRFNRPISLTEGGQVLGYANRYVGTGVGENFFGRSAWVFNHPTGTRRIGLLDAAHTQTGGFQYNYGFKQNEDGHVIGFARRYNGSSYIGQSAWLYADGGTVEIGTTGPGSSSSTGERYHEPYDINEDGDILGFSGRYSGSSYLGHVTWLRTDPPGPAPTTTIEVGLTDAAHTRADGYRESMPRALNEAGQVAGVAERFGGSVYKGQSSWVYDGVQTRVINPEGAEHTSSDGQRISGSVYINASGQVLGFAQRYGAVGEAGQSTWLYNGGGGATAIVGLTDAAHTTSSGRRFSTPVALTGAGAAIGFSEQRATRDGGAPGQSAWLHRNGASRAIGLYGDLHTHDTGGGQFNTPQHVNLLGEVAGDAMRFNGNAPAGWTAWFYEPKLDQTFPLEFSVSASGYAHSTVQYLGDGGVALGQYVKYDGDAVLGQHAFYWSLDDGFFDLGTLVNGGLSAQGWESLFESTKVNGNGQLIGRGRFSGDFPTEGDGSGAALAAGDLTYLLTPVPEPAFGLALIPLAAAATTVRGRRRRRPAGIR